MKYSFIVPIYNVQSFLRECLDSIFNQDFNKESYEVILIDDGSTDNCPNIVEEYRDRGAIIVHQENRGLGGARNVGIDISNGEYLCFVDSDDLISSKYLYLIDSVVSDFPYDIINIGYTSEMKEISTEDVDTHYRINLSSICNYPHMAYTNVIRKSLFENVRFPNRLIHEDLSTIPVILCKAKSAVRLNSKIYYYRDNENSIMNTLTIEKELQIMDSFLWMKELMNRNSIDFHNRDDVIELGKCCYRLFKRRIIDLEDKDLESHLIKARDIFKIRK